MKTQRKPKAKSIVIQVTEAEHKIVKSHAAALGISIRKLMIDLMKDILEDKKAF
jgi:hypothetical protein